ncbi:GDP-mannose 4,6-dehydratase, partial [bacterium]|nr:GDP-mannose 4,6-dehydratase [bacterium]
WYDCPKCGKINPQLRELEQMQRGDWNLYCPKCKSLMIPIPTDETKPLESNSIYAITKKDQEEMCLNIGKAYDIPTVALRYFNVYGPRQSLSNPYTGVAAIFMSRIKNDHSPFVYEDGLQSRDFVSVHDIAAANIMAMEKDEANYEMFNVGTGIPIAIKEIAEILAKLYGKTIKPEVSNKFRKGDVRYCYADITKIKTRLGFTPKVDFKQGMKELIEWSRNASAEDKFEQAEKELAEKGLV